MGATGDVVCGHPTICGGVALKSSSITHECYMLQHVDGEATTYTKVATTLEPRVYAASVVLNNTMLWLTGGSGHNTTEWINISVSAN